MLKRQGLPIPDSPVDRYLRLWKLDQPAPDLAAYLACQPYLSTRSLVDVLLVDQQLRWQHGEGRLVEDYLCAFPELAERSDLVLDLIYGEVQASNRQGLPAALATYTERFPHLADELAKQCVVADWLRQTCLDDGMEPL